MWYTLVKVCKLADSVFFENFLYQGGVKAKVSGVVEDLKFKISEGSDQFWMWPSESLNLRSSNTQETVDFTPPWYKKFSKNPESASIHTVSYAKYSGIIHHTCRI